MDNITKLIEMWGDGITEPTEIFLFMVLLILIGGTLYNKLNKIIVLNDFDRLLIPKHEKKIQQIILKINEYVSFIFLYLYIGFILSILLNTLNSLLIGLFTNTFLLFHLLLVPKLILNELPNNWKSVVWLKKIYGTRTTNFILIGNIILSMAMYSLIMGNPFINKIILSIEYLMVLIIVPIYFLFVYRAFAKNSKYSYEYECQVISEETFNKAFPIVKYSLDKDKIVFTSTKVKVNEELLMFDRSCSKYFKFTKKETLLSKTS